MVWLISCFCFGNVSRFVFFDTRINISALFLAYSTILSQAAARLPYKSIRNIKSNMATLTKPLPKLVLHFDVNETILLVDDAGGDTFENCLNKTICKNSIVQANLFDSQQLPTTWCDGSLISNNSTPPPLSSNFTLPSNTTSYYRAGGAAKTQAQTFTDTGSPGVGYQAIYNQLEQALRWPLNEDEDGAPDPRLCKDGIHHFLLPAFFHTISELKKRNRTFAIVIRTFGTDVEDVANALQAYADGAHLSRFTSVKEMTCKNFWDGRYNAKGAFQLTQRNTEKEETKTIEETKTTEETKTKTPTPTPTPTTITNESDIISLLHGDRNTISCVACTDHYDWWKNHGYNPAAGKPVWLTKDDEEYLPIFFDDNIHNDSKDSIVAVRVRDDSTKEFSALNGEETLEMQGRHVVRVPTFAPILNENWFLEQIDVCEKEFLRRREL